MARPAGRTHKKSAASRRSFLWRALPGAHIKKAGLQPGFFKEERLDQAA